MMQGIYNNFKISATNWSFKTEILSFRLIGQPQSINKWNEINSFISDCMMKNLEKPTNNFNNLSKNMKKFKKECKRSMI